jgi:hypothetical protein
MLSRWPTIVLNLLLAALIFWGGMTPQAGWAACVRSGAPQIERVELSQCCTQQAGGCCCSQAKHNGSPCCRQQGRSAERPSDLLCLCACRPVDRLPPAPQRDRSSSERALDHLKSPAMGLPGSMRTPDMPRPVEFVHRSRAFPSSSLSIALCVWQT